MRDYDVYQRIRKAVLGTGLFASHAVRLNEPWDWAHIPADCSFGVAIWPKDWNEESQANWDGEFPFERTVNYGIAVGVREPIPELRLDKLGRLESAIQNALSGASLGNCVRDKTSVSVGRYKLRPEHPEQNCEMDGRFCYFLGVDSREETVRNPFA